MKRQWQRLGLPPIVYWFVCHATFGSAIQVNSCMNNNLSSVEAILLMQFKKQQVHFYCFSAVGEDKVIDVIDVHTQETIVMNVKEFCQAFETPVEERTSTLNCLGLEVSELPLGKS